MTTTTFRLPLQRFAGGGGTFHETAVQGWSTMRLWRERARQRRHLAGLTAKQLDDIGISLQAAHAEATKPFWRA